MKYLLLISLLFACANVEDYQPTNYCIDQVNNDQDRDTFYSGACNQIDNDCNDKDSSVYPGATEWCDCIDNNCSGNTDEECNYSVKIRRDSRYAIKTYLTKFTNFGCYADKAFNRISVPEDNVDNNFSTNPLQMNTIFMDYAAENTTGLVWYYGHDHNKYLFSQPGAFESWFGPLPEKCCLVKMIPNEIANSIPRGLIGGGTVCYKPGLRVYISILPPATITKFFVISHGCIARHIKPEIAAEIFGEDWQSNLEYIDWTHYFNYFAGPDINNINDYSIKDEQAISRTIDQNQGLI